MSGRTILVAEDDASVRMTLEFVLRDEGFEVIFARDGEEAVSLAQGCLPDVILLDKIMPKMDGKDVLIALRADEKTSDIPVFVLTGMARGPGDDWPGAHFIGKPFSPEHLIQKINAVLKDR